MSWYSIYGTGATIFDVRPEPDDGRIRFTVWLSVFWVPLIPRSSWSALLAAESNDAMGEKQYFKDLVRVPHEGSRLMRTWLLAIIALFVTIGPIAIMIDRTNGRAATTAEMVLVFGLVLWTVGLLFGIDSHRKKKLGGDRVPTIMRKNLPD